MFSDVADEGELAAIGHELLQTISEPCEVDGVRVRVAASIGVAFTRTAQPSRR